MERGLAWDGGRIISSCWGLNPCSVEVTLELQQGVQREQPGRLWGPQQRLRGQGGRKFAIHRRRVIFSTLTKLKLFRIEKMVGALAPSLNLSVHLNTSGCF